MLAYFLCRNAAYLRFLKTKIAQIPVQTSKMQFFPFEVGGEWVTI
jgi:hypothetical protein